VKKPKPHDCPACQITRELEHHRDYTAERGTWRWWALNWPVVIARAACPASATTGDRDE
jgi:hypothetical protein